MNIVVKATELIESTKMLYTIVLETGTETKAERQETTVTENC